MCWEHHRGSRQCPDPRWWSGRCRALPAPPPHRASAPTPASSSRCRRTSGGPRRRRSPPRASGEAERTGLLAQIRELPARHLVQVGLGGRRAHLDTGSGLGSRLEPTTTILCRQPRSMGCFSYLPAMMPISARLAPPAARMTDTMTAGAAVGPLTWAFVPPNVSAERTFARNLSAVSLRTGTRWPTSFPSSGVEAP